MSKEIHRFMLLLMMLAVLVSSAVGTTTVYADDGSGGGETSEPVVEETLPVEDVVPSEPAGGEVAPDEEQPAAPVEEQPIAGEGAAAPVEGEPAAEESITVTEILEQLPEDTELVVINEAGAVEPLVTEAAAEIIAAADPMWCPSSAASVTADCVNHTTVAGLLLLIKDKTVDGTIYFTPTYDTDDVIFDGSTLGTTANYALTIQGGWAQATNVGDAISFSGSTKFTVPVTIQHWNANVFIYDIEVASIVDKEDAHHGLGVQLDGSGNIELDNVYVHNTLVGDGAKLSNVAGGDVSITNSRFEYNLDGNGLKVESRGTITLDTVQASGNLLTGAYLQNCLYGTVTPGLCAGTGAVTVTSATSNNQFNLNGKLNSNGDGLVIDSGGAITLNHVQANGNGSNGTKLTSLDTDGTGNVTVGQSEFSDNDDNGLKVNTDGSIQLTEVDAYLNNTGATLVNTANVGVVDVEVTNSNFGVDATTGNDWTGLHIESGGAVTLTDVVASFNGTNGGYIEAEGDITVEDSTFNQNVQFDYPTDPGLYANSNGGNIELTDVVADGNEHGAGAVLKTNGAGTIDVTSDVTGAHFNGNGTFGIQADSVDGDITLDGIVASLNKVKGAYLNSHGLGNIFINGGDFIENGSYGIYAGTKDGDITLDGVTASLNGVKGAYLSSGGLGNILVQNNSAFVENGSYGIYASTSKGGITLDHVTVTGDNGVDDGAVGADNLTDVGAVLVTSNGGNVFVSESLFELNTETGLKIVSSGLVDLINVTADQNGGNGAEVYSTYTDGCRCPDDKVVNIAVTVTGGAFTDNGEYGLMVKPGPTGTLDFGDPSTTFFDGNGTGEYLLDLGEPVDCEKCGCDDPKPPVDPKPTEIVDLPFDNDKPVRLNYKDFADTILRLPNGNSAQFVNPSFESIGSLQGLLEEDLPGRLGAGTNFVAGMSVGLIDDKGNPIIGQDATITVEFKVPEDSRGTFSILYWDPTLNDGKGGWVELPLYEAGTSFPLNPDDIEDERTILSGVRQVGDTVTVTVNFPGIFVLVAE